MLSARYIPYIKFLLIAAISVHIAYLIYGLINGGLGVNPIETLTHTTGEWGLNLLLITLAITPLRRLFHWNSLIRFRRLLGLCSFFYIFLHFMIFLVFDHFFDWLGIWQDIVKRPYIFAGMLAFVIMLPLAVTSVSSLQRRMGQYWLKLHRLVYFVGILGVLHYLWLVKADLLEPLLYALVLAVLLFVRVYFFVRKRWGRFNGRFKWWLRKPTQ